MKTEKVEKAGRPLALDREDERVRHASGLRAAGLAVIDRMRSGDLGSLPVVVGLAIIWAVFETLNPIFLSSTNLVNLLFDSSTVGFISLGIVCILMVGEIDLSVGSISGLSSALLGVLWVNRGWPFGLAIPSILLVAVIIGCGYALLFIRFGMPSFVATLAGLLAFLGLQLSILGPTGSINLPYDSWFVRFGQVLMMPAWVAYCLGAVIGACSFLINFRTSRRRAAAGLSARGVVSLAIQAAAIAIGLEWAVWYLYFDRGVPWLFGLFVAFMLATNYALTRTQWGRSMKAIGGNREAARRAGINVGFIFTSAFATCSVFAACGGLLSAARLASANLQAGTGDVNLNAIAAAVIGGTSLFGGRGSAYSALLGVLVIQSISSGLTLLDLSSSLRYMITGGVLAAAVVIDSLARRSRVTHGRA